ncbi:MAG: hypothetical protein JSU92_03350 [Deltaproteobacteria bacterium]|nr:MAG: hypothetical protein JSU92_03350 [Deltaproteobacteria bacterium]
MGSRFISKFSLPLYLFIYILFIGSVKPVQAIEEGDCFNTSTVVITGSITDSSGISEIEVTVDGSPPSSFNIDNGNWTATFTGLSDGPHTLLVTGTDACGSGNTAVTDPLGFEVDTVATVSITSPVDGETIIAGDVLVTGTADTDIPTVNVISSQGHNESSSVVGGNWSVVLTGVTVPSIAITAQGTDDCGNTGFDSVTVPILACHGLLVSVEPTTGCPGDPVTIAGTNFGAILGSVNFDSVPATIILWSDTTIIVEAPGGDYTIVTVYPVDGCSYSLPDFYSYDNTANVTITSPMDGQTILTDKITVIGTADTDITTVTVTSDQGHSESSPVVAGGWTVNLIGVSTPSIVITAQGTDDCGNTGSDSVTLPVAYGQPCDWFVNDDASGLGTGKSWENAFTVVQVAVNTSTSGEIICVAEGTYINSPTSTASVLTMKAGVDIYGGFTGTESSPSERGEPEDHPTILDGEDTSYHVVLGASSARLDGFTVIGGNDINYGGGMNNNSVTDLTVANCTFSGNSAGEGGGMNNLNSSPTIANCIFNGNQANWGGGVSNQMNSSPTITNCIFNGNSAHSGGGIWNYSSLSSPTITNCTFTGNSASTYGGGIFNENFSSPTITNCILIGNSANWGGGMFSDNPSSPMITNCIFSENLAAIDGGGMYNANGSSPTITNCIFSGNQAGMLGGGLYNYWYSSPEITNCIMWGDNPDEIYNDFTSMAIVSYSDIDQDGYAGSNGNIREDPLFVSGSDLHLQSGSPCIDAADGDAAPVYDMEGNPRVDDPGTPNTGIGTPPYTDMGAYEYQP